MQEDAVITRAADILRQSDGLLITAGAGMGVDSGLPDFRGDEGFWQAYPPLAQAGIRFTEIANPAAFHASPRLAWGFYGHRLALYRATVPHRGFALLQAMAARMPAGAFVFTSNVDGQFQRAGFEAARIVECHGSIHHLQCSRPCGDDIWPADTFSPDVDHATCRLRSDPPACPRCGALARPNILMFNDAAWLFERTQQQERRLCAWLRKVDRLAVIELGAGIHVPSVRRQGEALKVPLIRINPRAATVPRAADVSLPTTALAGLDAIARALGIVTPSALPAGKTSA